MNFNDFTLQRNIIVDAFPDLPVTSFSIYFFPAKGRQHGSKQRSKWDHKSPERRIFEILGRFRRRCFFDVFWDQKKSAPILEKSAGGANKNKNPRYLLGGPAECVGLLER